MRCKSVRLHAEAFTSHHLDAVVNAPPARFAALLLLGPADKQAALFCRPAGKRALLLQKKNKSRGSGARCISASGERGKTATQLLVLGAFGWRPLHRHRSRAADSNSGPRPSLYGIRYIQCFPSLPRYPLPVHRPCHLVLLAPKRYRKEPIRRLLQEGRAVAAPLAGLRATRP